MANSPPIRRCYTCNHRGLWQLHHDIFSDVALCSECGKVSVLHAHPESPEANDLHKRWSFYVSGEFPAALRTEKLLVAYFKSRSEGDEDA